MSIQKTGHDCRYAEFTDESSKKETSANPSSGVALEVRPAWWDKKNE